MPETQRVGGCWLTGQQKLLLRAALLNGDEAINAWGKWVAGINIDAIDPGSYRLLPLLYHNLRTHGIDHPLMNKLKGVHRYTWYKNQVLFLQMGVLLQTFQNAGIRTLILKGAALTLLYYKDYGIRPMADFDILVPAEQSSAAMNILYELNWAPSPVSRDKLTEEYRSYTHATHFNNASGLDIDLHWHAISTCLERDADDDFWSGSISTRVGEIHTQALNSTDEFMLACVQGGLSWDAIPSIRWVADAMAILTAAPEIDWDRFLLQVQKHGLVLPMIETLGYLREELNVPIPDDVLRTLRNSPATLGERYEHKARTSPNELRGPLMTFWLHFSNYSRLKRDVDLMERLRGFPRYLQVVWNADHSWQVMFHLVFKLMRRMGQITAWHKDTLIDYLKRAAASGPRF
jgi:hypothetical protein